MPACTHQEAFSSLRGCPLPTSSDPRPPSQEAVLHGPAFRARAEQAPSPTHPPAGRLDGLHYLTDTRSFPESLV